MQRREAIEKVLGLLGIAVSGSTLSVIVSSCENPQQGASSLEKYHSVSQIQAKAIAKAADIIIPRTSTPGALDTDTPNFIIMMVNECFSPVEKKRFYAGLSQMNKLFYTETGKYFLENDNEKSLELMLLLEKEAKNHNNINGEKSEHFFIKKIKELTLLGYFTSEIGASKVLKYAPIPGVFRPCVQREPNEVSYY